MSKPPRKALHAYVSAEAHEQWHGFAARNGVSASALIQVIAPRLGDISDDALITAARNHDTAARARNRRPSGGHEGKNLNEEVSG